MSKECKGNGVKDIHLITFTSSLDTQQFRRKCSYQPPNEAAGKLAILPCLLRTLFPLLFFPLHFLSLSVMFSHYVMVIFALLTAGSPGRWRQRKQIMCQGAGFPLKPFPSNEASSFHRFINSPSCDFAAGNMVSPPVSSVQPGAQRLLQWASASASCVFAIILTFCHPPGNQEAHCNVQRSPLGHAGSKNITLIWNADALLLLCYFFPW